MREGVLLLLATAHLAYAAPKLPIGGAGGGGAMDAVGAINAKARSLTSNPNVACWIGSYGRGVGTIPNQCEADKVKEAGLCYPPCPHETPVGRGPVCWTKVGKLPVKSKRRGVGKVPRSCGDKHYDAGLCYRACKAGFKGIGPVCWQKECPKVLPFKCGAICTRSGATCGTVTAGLVTEGVTNAAQAKTNPTGLIHGAFDMIGRLVSWKQCNSLWNMPAEAFDAQAAETAGGEGTGGGLGVMGGGGGPSSPIHVHIDGLVDAINHLADSIAGRPRAPTPVNDAPAPANPAQVVPGPLPPPTMQQPVVEQPQQPVEEQAVQPAMEQQQPALPQQQPAADQIAPAAPLVQPV